MDIGENFVCPICLQLATQAVEVTCCSKIYCQEHAESTFRKFKSCSCCKSPHMDWHPSGIARRVISEIKVPCDYCDKQIEFGSMPRHLAQCPQKPSSCKICSECMPQSELAKHTIRLHEDEARQWLTDYAISQSRVQGAPAKAMPGANRGGRNLFDPVENREGNGSRIGRVAKYYCGQRQTVKCACCDGHCGEDDGCNCDACMEADVKRWNLAHGHLVNTVGYVCQVRKVGKGARVSCFRLVSVKEGGLFSKAAEVFCTFDAPCKGCGDVNNSLEVGRYKGLY